MDFFFTIHVLNEKLFVLISLCKIPGGINVLDSTTNTNFTLISKGFKKITSSEKQTVRRFIASEMHLFYFLNSFFAKEVIVGDFFFLAFYQSENMSLLTAF